MLSKLKKNGWRGWAKWVMGIQEGTSWDEHWASYVIDQSLSSTPETTITLFAK